MTSYETQEYTLHLDGAPRRWLGDKIANFAKEKGSQSQTDLSENSVFKSFVEQFAPGEKTGPAIDHDLATTVNELLTEKLTKEKLEPV